MSKEERKRERDFFTYNIAKQVSDFSMSYGEANRIIENVKFILEISMSSTKPTVSETPIDKWGNKLEKPSYKSDLPGTDGTGQD